MPKLRVLHVPTTQAPSYAANAGVGNTCEAGEPITDVAECEAAAAFLASFSFPGYGYRSDIAPPNGETSLDYAAGGCFVYTGEATEYNGFYMNTHPGSDTGTADHHKVCKVDNFPRAPPFPPGQAPAPPPPHPPAPCIGDDSKCSSSGGDCCACDASIGQTTCGWEEPATCLDGYVAVAQDSGDCQYSCYPAHCSADDMCLDSKCTSDGDDCYANGMSEPQTCADGYEPFAVSEYEYTCCPDNQPRPPPYPPGAAPNPPPPAPCIQDDSKCTSMGNDCWADGTYEAQTCADGYFAWPVGTDGSQYGCFPSYCPTDQLCDRSKCTSMGNDCYADGSYEAQTCSDGYLPLEVEYSQYTCCPDTQPRPPPSPPLLPSPPLAPFAMPGCADTGEDVTVVLSYHDLDDADDVPDSGATIAAGFSTDSSFYIGNDALTALDIAEAEMCVWYESAGSCVSNCVPITDSDFAYGGPELDWLRSGTHRVIALMSGQLETVTPDQGDDHASFYPRKIGSEVGPAWAPPNAWTCSDPNLAAQATWEQCYDCKYCFDCGTHGTCGLPVE